MNEIKILFSSIPVGKKRSYLNNIYLRGIQNFFDYNQTINNIDIDFILAYDFKRIVMLDDFLKDLRFFPNAKIIAILKCTETEIEHIDISEIRAALIKEYNLIFKVVSVEPSVVCTHSNCELTLHPFQERMRRSVINLIFNNQKRFLIHMPTGAGKTRTAVEILIDFIRLSSAKALLVNNFKILWIAQSNELCEQAYETFQFLYNKKGTQNIRIGHFYGNHTVDLDIVSEPAIIFCGIQKLLSQYQDNNLWQLIKNDNYLVIVDEAHRSVAKQWKKALDFFVNNSSTYLLGLTATPGAGSVDDISSGYTVANYYGNNKLTLTDEYYKELKKPIQYLIEQGFLAKIEKIDIESVHCDHAINQKDGEFHFTKHTLEYLSINAFRNQSIINIIKSNLDDNPNCKILIFSCGIEHNKILKSLLLLYGIESEYVDAGTENRSAIIDQFKHGQLNVLFNYGILTTGFDAPKTNVCIIARPISSIVMYSQMVGRILRGPKNKGNLENRLYTIKDNFNHGDYDEMFNSFNNFYN